jgi:hypothetical protein
MLVKLKRAVARTEPIVHVVAGSAATVASVILLTGCAGRATDAGGLTAADRTAAQSAMNALHGSNIALQLVNVSDVAGAPPSACRVHLVARKPSTSFRIYVFWVPMGTHQYAWMTMLIGADASLDSFHLSFDPLSPPGRSHSMSERMMLAHAGDAFGRPGGGCRLLKNGDLRLVPAR